jgi:pimeloyl-ACP methyl ester carboxylesterase
MELNFKSFGQGDPVIILHGLFGNLDNWQTFARQLAEHFMVYIIDLRNHGRSPHLDEMNYRAAAEDLMTFLESQWIYEAHIIGHSMGGKTAMQFAFDHPDLLKRLVVVDIAPKAYPGGHEQIFQAMLGLKPETLESRSEAEEKLAETITDPAIRLFLLKNLSRNKNGGYDWKMNLPVLYRDYKHILSAIEGEAFEGPSLFVRGERSDYIQDADWPLIRELFPKAQLTTVPGAGHWVHAEAPKALLEEVKRFLLAT